jgi:hypothetical protein
MAVGRISRPALEKGRRGGIRGGGSKQGTPRASQLPAAAKPDCPQQSALFPGCRTGALLLGVEIVPGRVLGFGLRILQLSPIPEREPTIQ